MPSTRPRADKQRNRDAILAAAAGIFDRDGAGASLEEIARVAGVGSATLHRHFAGRQELLSAVFHDRLEEIARRAPVLAAAHPPQEALVSWLTELAIYIAATRGLAVALFALPGGAIPMSDSCDALVLAAIDELLAGAVRAGFADPAVTATDLLTLANGVAAVTEHDPAATARLIALATHGIGKA